MDVVLLFFKQKTGYEMRISDWSSDVCSSDLERTLILQWAERVDHRTLAPSFARGSRPMPLRGRSPRCRPQGVRRPAWATLTQPPMWSGGAMFVPFSVNDFLDRAVQVYGDRIGVVDEPHQPAPSQGSLTYREIGDLARRQADRKSNR